MATIRPSIYIGLGGTGIIAISKTKKMYEDAFGKGNIPEQIAFAAIDFNLEMVNDPILATDMRDDFIPLRGIGNPKKLYEEQRKEGEFKWMFPNNSGFLPSRVVDGAGQVRTNGRFLTEMIAQSIENRIKSLQTQIKAITISDKIKVANTDNKIEFHVAMSLAGGTGCGSFLNIAQIIKDIFDDDAYIIGYGVLHGIFRTMDVAGNKSSKVIANAYSAILDLDYFMHATPDNPIKINLNRNEKQRTTPIYDEFYVIDNVTEQGDCIEDISKLCEVIGTCLYVAGNELGSSIQGVMSNKHWARNGDYNISPKKGWVQALGACQVVYKGDLLAEIYGLKAAIELIRKLQNTGVEMQQKALDWTKYVAIREDGSQYNMLTDYIYEPSKIVKVRPPNLDVKDSITTIKTTVSKYLTLLPEYPIEQKIEEIVTRIITNLRKTITDLLGADNGVGSSLGFINSLETLLNQFRNEMELENAEYEKKILDSVTALENVKYKEYEDYTKKWIARKKEDNLNEMIAQPALKILKDKLESARRKSASLIFTKVLFEISELKNHLEDLNNKLSTLLGEYKTELSGKQTTTQSSLVFEIDLSYNEKLTLDLNSDDVSVNDYIKLLNKSLYNVELSIELDRTIRDFANKLNKAKEYRNKLIVDVIQELNENEYLKSLVVR